jgi:hypothetical protein
MFLRRVLTAIQQAAEGMDEPVIGHGMRAAIVGEDGFVVGIERLGAGTPTEGLMPALLISNEPNGIPAGEAPPGDGGNVKVADAPLPEVVSQIAEVPNGVPNSTPPPS